MEKKNTFFFLKKLWKTSVSKTISSWTLPSRKFLCICLQTQRLVQETILKLQPVFLR